MQHGHRERPADPGRQGQCLESEQIWMSNNSYKDIMYTMNLGIIYIYDRI